MKYLSCLNFVENKVHDLSVRIMRVQCAFQIAETAGDRDCYRQQLRRLDQERGSYLEALKIGRS